MILLITHTRQASYSEMLWFMGESYICLCYVPVKWLTDRWLPGCNWPSCLYLFACNNKALPGLDSRWCTRESVALCQHNNNRFVTGRRDKGEKKDEKVVGYVAKMHDRLLQSRLVETNPPGGSEKAGQISFCSCRASYRPTSETASVCGICKNNAS